MKLDQDAILRLTARAVRGHVPVAIKSLDAASKALNKGDEVKALEHVGHAKEWLKKRGA